MALPRRPYLLGLFPGTSNDWATQDGAKGGREGGGVGWGEGAQRERRWQIEKARGGRGGEKESIMRSHAQKTNTLISNRQRSFERSLRPDFMSENTALSAEWEAFSSASRPGSAAGGGGSH